MCESTCSHIPCIMSSRTWSLATHSATARSTQHAARSGDCAPPGDAREWRRGMAAARGHRCRTLGDRMHEPASAGKGRCGRMAAGLFEAAHEAHALFWPFSPALGWTEGPARGIMHWRATSSTCRATAHRGAQRPACPRSLPACTAASACELKQVPGPTLDTAACMRNATRQTHRGGEEDVGPGALRPRMQALTARHHNAWGEHAPPDVCAQLARLLGVMHEGRQRQHRGKGELVPESSLHIKCAATGEDLDCVLVLVVHA